MVQALDSSEITKKLEKLSEWKIVDNKLTREYDFTNFVEAFGFMTQVALLAEKNDHHPEWENVYNRVKVQLITHDAGPAISEKDFELAYMMEELQ